MPEAYLALSVFSAQVKCGHAYLNFFNRSKPIAAAPFRNPDRLLFYFRWIDRAKPPALVVDLRGNGGGIDVGNKIVKRLVTSDLGFLLASVSSGTGGHRKILLHSLTRGTRVPRTGTRR